MLIVRAAYALVFGECLMPKPSISMAVCTYNRCAMLKDAVQSLLEQSVLRDPDQIWEIIIVDNNSTDDTPAYLKELSQTNPDIRCFIETSQGSAYTRSAAFNNARHDIIAYIDDDETADQDWAKEIIRVFAENDNVGCVGGPVLLEEQDKERIPKWFSKDMYSIIGEVHLPVKTTDYVESMDGTGVVGGNMALSRAVREYGLSFPGVGRSGNLLLCDEDGLMARNISAAGFRVFLAPRAKATHKFLPERATVKHAVRYYKGMAYTRYVPYKLPYYVICLFYRILSFPLMVLFSYRKRLKHFARICYEYYRIQASLLFYMRRK